MKLQLALDVLDADRALQLAEDVRPVVDILEIGTPLMKFAGISVLEKLRKAFPEKQILVDLKTMDVGDYEADFCFAHGADIVTVLGVADCETIRGSLSAAERHGGQVMVDLINHPDKARRACEAERMGAHFVGVHTGIDQQRQGVTPLQDLRTVRKASSIPVMVAGGITAETVSSIAEESPHTVVVGGGITGAPDPGAAARRIREAMG